MLARAAGRGTEMIRWLREVAYVVCAVVGGALVALALILEPPPKGAGRWGQ